jgi:hypothetical protein
MSSREILMFFRRKGDGSWTCVAPATIQHPKGRITVTPDSRFMPGTVFLDVDLAAYLDELNHPVPQPPSAPRPSR